MVREKRRGHTSELAPHPGGGRKTIGPPMVVPRALRSLAPGLAAASLVVSALASLGATCNPQPPPEAPKPCDVQVVTLNIYASDNINPNENGNPRPVVVQLYQLKNEVRMENATYDQIL